MRVGIINAVRNHPGSPYPLTEVYEDYIGDALLAEQLGFDFTWYGEHHFTTDQWTPSPLMVAAAAAAKTDRIRIGTSVLCLPFHNPLRVAEDVAVLDVISRGRFDFGIGVGSQYEEYRTFGVPIGERFGRTWEAIAFIERCFSEEGTFSHAGRYYTFPDVTFTTKPVQQPVPVWVGAQGPQSITRTAERGYHMLAGGSQRYDEALRAAGRNPDDHFVAPMQQVALADTTDAAWEAAAEGLHYFINFYRLRRRLDGTLPSASDEITMEMIRGGGPGGGTGMFMAGTPDEVIERFTAIRDGAQGRVTHLPLGFRHAGMRTADVRRSMELFAKEIMPVLR
jgi:alkanesulfonate monooxygenase SsuD/methylene tetrahydromethanopterin reductase-like flavin-dependent oxidoreductase (luciferase family)